MKIKDIITYQSKMNVKKHAKAVLLKLDM